MPSGQRGRHARRPVGRAVRVRIAQPVGARWRAGRRARRPGPRQGPGAGISVGQSAQGAPARALSARSARLPAAHRSCGQPGAITSGQGHAAPRTEATADGGAGRRQRAAPATPTATAPARQPLAAVSSADVETLAAQPVDVVSEADDEQERDEHEADDRGALDEAVGDRARGIFSATAQKMWPPSRAEGEQVHHRQRAR